MSKTIKDDSLNNSKLDLILESKENNYNLTGDFTFDFSKHNDKSGSSGLADEENDFWGDIGNEQSE